MKDGEKPGIVEPYELLRLEKANAMPLMSVCEVVPVRGKYAK